MQKRKLNYYVVLYEKEGKLNKQAFTNLEKALINIRVLVYMGYGVQINKCEVEVELCSNVWNKC